MRLVHVSMPLFNEATTIRAYLREIDVAFAAMGLRPRFVIANDCSTDDSLDVLRACTDDVDLIVVSNTRNQGHGPTTLLAMRSALADDAEFVLNTDSDGQFTASDLAKVARRLIDARCDIVLCRRHGRDEEWYRAVGTLGARLLASAYARRPVADSNCPLRAYRRRALTHLLPAIPPDALVPGVMLSVAIARSSLHQAIMDVRWQPRAPGEGPGTMWGRKSGLRSLARYARFCAKATRQFLTWRPTTTGSRG